MLWFTVPMFAICGILLTWMGLIGLRRVRLGGGAVTKAELGIAALTAGAWGTASLSGFNSPAGHALWIAGVVLFLATTIVSFLLRASDRYRLRKTDDD